MANGLSERTDVNFNYHSGVFASSSSQSNFLRNVSETKSKVKPSDDNFCET